MATKNLGRVWSLMVSSSENPSSGDVISYSTSDWDPEALRITFEVVQQPRALWHAEIAIYNLNAQTEQQALQAGCWVELYAGYRGALPGLIFKGRVFQPMWERIRGIDYKITLRCIIGLQEMMGNFVNLSLSANSTQANVIQTMARQAHRPFATTLVDLNAYQKQLPRGKVVFGSVADYFGQIGDDNNTPWFMSADIPAMGAVTNGTQPADYTYAPPIPLGANYQQQPGVNYTLLSTPQQTQTGVSFMVEMDSRLIVRRNPWQVVGLNMSQINQAPLQIGQYYTPLSQSGEYVVVGIRHVGDSRGEDWYTEVEAATPGGILAALAQATR